MQERFGQTTIDYIQNKDAPIYRVHGLHDLQLLPDDGLFELYRLKRTDGGVLYMETELFVEMPRTAIPPGVALTVRKISATIAANAAGAVSRVLLSH